MSICSVVDRFWSQVQAQAPAVAKYRYEKCKHMGWFCCNGSFAIKGQMQFPIYFLYCALHYIIQIQENIVVGSLGIVLQQFHIIKMTCFRVVCLSNKNLNEYDLMHQNIFRYSIGNQFSTTISNVRIKYAVLFCLLFIGSLPQSA